ncbi:hypothetical protein C8J56DRAFT_1030673 [Mycena floridula]|nr:hypothetical protein C8J56DRAFT_1030673 [Mycena floridula]
MDPRAGEETELAVHPLPSNNSIRKQATLKMIQATAKVRILTQRDCRRVRIGVNLRTSRNLVKRFRENFVTVLYENENWRKWLHVEDMSYSRLNLDWKKTGLGLVNRGCFLWLSTNELGVEIWAHAYRETTSSGPHLEPGCNKTAAAEKMVQFGSMAGGRRWVDASEENTVHRKYFLAWMVLGKSRPVTA